jgi:triacylglycerol lipase
MKRAYVRMTFWWSCLCSCFAISLTVALLALPLACAADDVPTPPGAPAEDALAHDSTAGAPGDAAADHETHDPGGSIIIDPPARPDIVSPPPTDTVDPPDLLLRDGVSPRDGETETPPGCPDYTKTPVLMIHGFGAGADITWRTTIERLVRDCWPPEYLVNPEFEDLLGCSPENARNIAAWVHELKARTGAAKVDILAFSMGALDARYYIKHLCGYRHVRYVVSLAGANHGSALGCLPFVSHSCGAEVMCRGMGAEGWRDNPFLVDLNDCDETPGEDILYTSIWSAGDEIVRPPESSILAGARNIQMQHPYGHAGMFVEEEPYPWIKLALEGGGRNDNVPTGDEPCYRICAPGM